MRVRTEFRRLQVPHRHTAVWAANGPCRAYRRLRVTPHSFSLRLQPLAVDAQQLFGVAYPLIPHPNDLHLVRQDQ